MMNKSILRKEMLEKRNSLSHNQIIKKSQDIFHSLYADPLYKNSNTIMTYISIGKEVFTHGFIQRAIADKKKVVIPVCQPSTKEIILSQVIDFEKDLEKGHWGLWEPTKETLRPVSSSDLDLILVPGLTFTDTGLRLGYGGGYYDRFLSSLSKYTPTIALSFELQVIKDLPTESFDVPVDYIVTESRWIDCLQNREREGI